jgi:hypothetical protein
MAPRDNEKRGRAGALAGLLVALSACVHGGAALAQSNTLRDALIGRRPAQERNVEAPLVAHYRVDAGPSFIVDRSETRAVLMRLDDQVEVWALKPTPGPRGDIIYKNDVGEPMLRATRLGGLTLFTDDQPQGAAAALDGAAAPLKPPHISGPSALLQVFAQASARVSRQAQRLVPFEAEDVPAGAEPWFADAANLAAAAMIAVAGEDGGRARVGRISRVRVLAGANPGAVLVREARPRGAGAAADQLMQITVAPLQGYAGRPSSSKMISLIPRR